MTDENPITPPTPPTSPAQSTPPAESFAPPTPPPTQPPVTPPPVASSPYSAAPAYGVAPAVVRTNTLAIVAFVLAFFVQVAAVICGHIALGQIKRTGEGGRGFAIASLIIGYVGIFFGIIWIIVLIVGIAAGVNSGSFNTGY